MFKGYRLTYFAVIAFTLIFAIGCRCTSKQHYYRKKKDVAGLLATEHEKEKANYLPLPLKDRPEQILYRKGYIVSYNKDAKIPNWVAWHLTSNHTTGPNKRPGSAWHEDLEVPSPRASIYDYRESGWSRGHMCPAGDNKWDAEAMYESFLMTNCCPQNRNLNSGDWNQIEMSCRRWAEKFGDIYIVCGPILFRQEHETIGANKIVVPEAFFKVVLCLNGTPKGIGFICRNTEGGRKRDLYVNSINQVERITGMTFFPNIPRPIAESVKMKANLKEWDKRRKEQ